MTDEIKPEVIKKTQRSLGKYVKKPPLTEKLLRKPPFRFLHDIISTVIKETGFLNNLYSEEELNSEIRDKEAKIAFLTKLINVVNLITGGDLKVRPTKVIAGLEPAKTNELLQAIGKALEKNINSEEAVNHYKASLEKDPRNLPISKISKDETPKTAAARPISKGMSEQHDTVIEPRKASVKKQKEQTDIGKKDPTTMKKSKQLKKARTVVDDATQLKASVGVTTNNKNVDHKSSVNSLRESTRAKSDDINVNDVTGIQLSRTPSEDQKKPEAFPPETAKISNEPDPGEENNDGLRGSKSVLGDMKIPEDAPAPTQSSVSDEAASVSKDSSKNFPRSRPASARPAAPKLRWKLDIGERHNTTEIAENDAVIVDNFDDQNDDKDSMVVLETDTNDYSAFKDRGGNINPDNTQEHGYLVAQILETQRELAKSDNIELISNKDDALPERTSQKNSETIAKEVEKLRSMIQTLTRATHPMGKLLDFLQEDVELMEKELSDWKNQSRQLCKQLEGEKAESEAAIQPLRESFNGIQTSIEDQLDKIYQIKLNIMKNNHKIQQLLLGRS